MTTGRLLVETLLRRGAFVIAGAALLGLCAIVTADDALAHGGRIFKPPLPPTPGGGLKPGQRPMTPPPPTSPPPPTTPPPNGLPGGRPTSPGPGPLPTPATGGRTRPRALSATAPRWQMWWDLNRWRYFPDRAALNATGRPVTVTGVPLDPRLLPENVLSEKRSLLCRELILPFLLERLDPKRKERPEVVAAAALALGRSCQDHAEIELLLALAQQKDATNVERESAALATGLLRREDKARQFEGTVLDRVRATLLSLFDDRKAPARTRAFAVFALGMLADQPYATELGREGKLTVKALWQRLQARDLDREETVALLTALGMQPARSVPRELSDDLRRVVFGRNLYRRTWSPEERSHALATIGRWATPDSFVTLCRVATDRRLPTPIRRAGFSALGHGAEGFNSESRAQGAQAILRGLRSSSDSLTRGLGHIALGRLLGADLRAGHPSVLLRTEAAHFLLGQARNAPTELYGFSVIGLALSARGLQGTDPRTAAHAFEATQVVLKQFHRAKRNAARQEPLAIGLGLLQAGEALVPLNEVVANRRASADLRGYAAIALALIGRPERTTIDVLRKLLLSHRSPTLSSKAALALSFLSGRRETRKLVAAMDEKPSQWVLSQLAAALGHLGDIEAVDSVLAIARDRKRMEETRALAVASLGLLGDPHTRPGLFRLTGDANYFAPTDALSELFTIL